MSASGDGDGMPRARPGAPRLVLWWARDYVYALGRQLSAIVSRSDPSTYQSGDRTPIVVLPGVYETWRFLMPAIRALHDRGHPVHVIDSLGWNNRAVVETAGLVAAHLEQHGLRGVVFLAHSKGGLVGKQVMSTGSAAARVEAMLAVATPFGGSSYARFLPGRSIRIFRPSDATILALSLVEAVNSHIVSVYGCFDPHIPDGSRLLGARNVELDTPGHFRVLADPGVLAEIERLAP